MPPRILNFLPLDALFFILNILGHDVYHDFGSDSGRLIDSMEALNMINSFLGLAGGTKVKSQQTQLEYATPIRKPSFISQNLKNIKIPLAMGPGQPLRQTPISNLSPNSQRRARAIAAQSRQEMPSRFQPTPSSRLQPSPRVSVDAFKEQQRNEKEAEEEAERKAERAKQQYLSKTEKEKLSDKLDSYITYIAENIQIAYEFNAFNYLVLQRFRLYNLDYNKLDVSVKTFNKYSVEEKMLFLLSLLDQTQDLIYGNKNILDRDLNKLINCNQVFITINNAIAKKYILENINSDESLIIDFRDFLNLDILKPIIKDNSALLKNNAQQMEIEEDVWETDEEDDNEDIRGKRNRIFGGAKDTILSLQQYQALLTEFTNELDRTEANQVFINLGNRQFNMIKNVSEKSNIKVILNKNQQYQTIEVLEKVLDEVIKDKIYKNALSNDNKINMLNDAYKGFLTRKITEYTEKIADIIAEQEARRAARAAEAAEAAERAAERAAIQASREAQGKPGPKHLSVRNDFMETIIKMVLVNCGIYQFNGDPAISDLDVPMNQPYINMANDDNDFTKQLGILIAKSPFSYPQGWTRVPGVPDDVLFDHFKEDQSIKNIPPPARSTLSYIVNNAALIGQHGLDGNYFCPISSILDGQSTCGYEENRPDVASKGQRGLERGDMDFKIQGSINNQNANLYYNGKSTQTPNNPHQYTYQINLGFPAVPPQLPQKTKTILLSKTMKLKDDDLTAQKALKHTLDSMIVYYQQKQQQIQLDPSIGFFDNLYRSFFNNDNNFTVNMYQILFKGSGDLFQEINAVCKNGGYVTTPTYYDDRISQFTNNNQDALRAFYANDRPSACRAFKFLRDGNQSEINQNAFGGYVGKDDESYLYFRKDIKTYKAINGGKANQYKVTGGKANKTKTKKRQQNIKTRKQATTKRRQ